MNDSALAEPYDDTANIHLDVLGQERSFSVTVALGRRTPLTLLPAARELTDQAVSVALDQAKAQGKSVRCTEGCSACCRHLIAVSPIEAVDIADHVGGLSAERQRHIRERFTETHRKLEAAGMLRRNEPRGQRALVAARQDSHWATVHELSRFYFEQQIPCPFLEDNRCSVYEHRPMVCREHHVFSAPENCARLDGRGVDPVTPPIDMAPTLSRVATELAGVPRQTMPLVLALEWVEAFGSGLRQTHDGLSLLQALVGQLDPKYRQEGTPDL